VNLLLEPHRVWVNGYQGIQLGRWGVSTFTWHLATILSILLIGSENQLWARVCGWELSVQRGVLRGVLRGEILESFLPSTYRITMPCRSRK